MEKQYQERYLDQALKVIRIGYAVLLVILGALVALDLSYGRLTGDDWAILAYVAVTLILTYTPIFRRTWKPYLAVTVGIAVAYAFATSTKSLIQSVDYPTSIAQVALVALRQAIYFTLAVGIMRLPAVWTVWWLFAMEAVGVGLVITYLHPEPTAISSYVYLTLFFVIFPSLGMIALERYHRADFLSNLLLETERAKSENLLLNILPASVAERLKADPASIADSYALVTVLFADIVEFTPLAATLTAPAVVDLLNRIFSEFDALAEKHGLEKIKTIGDAYMIVGGLPEPRPDHASAVAEMALEMREAIKSFTRPDSSPLSLRIGINTGPVVAGVIGKKRFLYDLWGDTVNMASRMESHGAPGLIQVMQSTREELASGYAFSEGRQTLVKGRGSVTTYELQGRLTHR